MPLRSVKMKRFIFGVPTAGLVAEVNAKLPEHLAHGYDGHVVSLN